jgi:hypothetical protein
MSGAWRSAFATSAVAAAHADLRERLASPAVAVERMAPLDQGVELLVGVRWDARFGRASCCCRCERGRCSAVHAGRSPVDLDAAAAVAALSRVAAAHPEIAEIEVNPLLALPDGAVGLDARVVPRRGPAG